MPFNYSLHTHKTWRFGQQHGLQNISLTSYFYQNIYQKVIYVYFYESNFVDKFIHIIFIFSNSTTDLFIIYIPEVWLKPCPKRQVFQYGGSICIVQLMLMDSFISSRHLVALGAVVVRRKQCVFDMSPLWSTTTGSQEHRLYQSKLINALLNWVYHQYFSS